VLIHRAREICYAARASGDHRAEHRRVLEILAAGAQKRLVVHVTTNVDGLATSVAVREFGGVWRPRLERCDIGDIVADARQVCTHQHGLLHFPVHGEVGLLADPDPTFHGARRLVTVDNDQDVPGHYSTIYQGMGRHRVPEVATTMAFSAVGYGLLSGLLRGVPTPLPDAEPIPAFEPADLVVIGYGAGSSPERHTYPFESHVNETIAVRGDAGASGAVWQPLCFQDSDEGTDRRTLEWFSARGFKVTRYAVAELAATVRSLVAP
jgi:hypothetical protein